VKETEMVEETKMRFERIPPDDIERNEQNPRTVFDEEKLDELAQSIREKGVLVPITVYEKGKLPGEFVLLDGERRVMAARRINLKDIPAWIATTPDLVQNLETMFHIHMEREEWSRIEQTRALERLIEEAGERDAKALARRTGISESSIVEMLRVLEQPKEYQQLIEEDVLPFNFFTELHHRVIEPLKKRRPSVFNRTGEQQITTQFVDRRKEGYLTNVTGQLRLVSQMIQMAERATDPIRRKRYDGTIERVINEITFPIEEAYEDVSGYAIATEKFMKRCEHLGTTLEDLIREGLSPQDAVTLKGVLRDLRRRIDEALEALG